ncbi:MAG TPA: B12-binding domain-containing radical SAM protein [Syntrophobacteraceae bacterium]|nr:B12-binding domain-containing radical SAM protein [Syntrophobacteraceae bacterium]
MSILGGSGFSLMPRELLTYLKADYGICGEGERTLPHLLDHIRQGSPITGIPGLISRNSMVPQCLPGPVLSTQEMLIPCRDRFANEQYLRFGGMGNIQTKRGCSFSCIYCTYPLIEGREVRLRRPGDVVREIEQLCARGISSFFVVDNVFNFPPHHAKSICQEILKRGLKVRWSCYLHPQFVTESLLSVMKDAGCSSVEFGADAGADDHLRRLGKSFSVAEIRRASELCHRVGLSFCHSLVFGGPGEDRNTIRATLDLMEEVSPTAIIAMVGIRLFPGTRLAEFAAPNDRISSDEAMLEPTFYLAETVRPYVLDLLREHAAQQPHWILPGSNVNINLRLQEKLRRFGLKGPLWEHMRVRRK